MHFNVLFRSHLMHWITLVSVKDAQDSAESDSKSAQPQQSTSSGQPEHRGNQAGRSHALKSQSQDAKQPGQGCLLPAWQRSYCRLEALFSTAHGLQLWICDEVYTNIDSCVWCIYMHIYLCIHTSTKLAFSGSYKDSYSGIIFSGHWLHVPFELFRFLLTCWWYCSCWNVKDAFWPSLWTAPDGLTQSQVSEIVLGNNHGVPDLGGRWWKNLC